MTRRHVAVSRTNDRAQKSASLTTVCLAAFLSCVAITACRSSSALNKNDLSVYQITNDQPGHEFVKTEKFLVPVNSVVQIEGLKFEPGASTLTPQHKLIVQEIFNALEEITENTPGDTNTFRVAEFKKMKFAIRGYPDASDNHASSNLAEMRAKSVFNFLTYLGTPAWRLTTTVPAAGRSHSSSRDSKNYGTVEFIRTR